MKKKVLSLALALAMCLGLAIPAFASGGAPAAYARDLTVQVTGYESNGVTPVIYLSARALKDANGNETNYVGIRDLASWLTVCGAAERYNVTWENNAIQIHTRTDYSSDSASDNWTGAEAEPYAANVPAIYVDGVRKQLEGIVITDSNGGGHTYYQLRALGEAIGFGVDWSAERGVYLKCTNVSKELQFSLDGDNYVPGGDYGFMGDVMSTYWFNFTVDDAYLCYTVGNYTAPLGKQLLVVHVTMKSTSSNAQPMSDLDFQAQWDDDAYDAYAWPITTDTPLLNQVHTDSPLSSQQLPTTYELPAGGTMSGYLIYEVPEKLPDGSYNTVFSISFSEEFADGDTGDVYFIYFAPYLY